MTVINSIEINNFRGIKQLTVSDFSKINLIVGMIIIVEKLHF